MNYFAYGSNLSKKQMNERVPGNKPKFTAVLPNHKLLFAGYSRQWKGGTASVKPFRGQRVEGAVYDITEDQFKKLDRFEDYPMTYDHLKVTVWTDSDQQIEAVTYIKKEQSPETKPSAEYLAAIRQGYRDWDIE
jgi:gamma-glutamylcyclotransferase